MTLKIDVSFTQEYIPNYDPKVEGESRKINKPSFKHKVTSTVQITDKKDGNMDTEMELAFDEDSGEYVLQPVANTTQKSIFDSDYKENLKPENEEESEKEEPKGIPQLPGPSEVEDEDVIDAEYTETEIGQETDEEPEEDITDEILGDAEGRTIWMAMITKTRRMKYENQREEDEEFCQQSKRPYTGQKAGRSCQSSERWPAVLFKQCDQSDFSVCCS